MKPFHIILFSAATALILTATLSNDPPQPPAAPKIPAAPQTTPLAERVLADVFDASGSLETALEYRVKISAYSLSVDECDADPLTAAFGPSRTFMAAFSRETERVTNAEKGDRFALVSDDGQIRAIIVFWDRMNRRFTDMRVDIVAPAKEIALTHGVKPGKLIKLIWEEEQ